MNTNRNGLIAATLAASALVGCAAQHRTELSEIVSEPGKVTTEYVSPRTTTSFSTVGGRRVMNTYSYPAHYNVKVVTPGCTAEFDNENFFNRLKGLDQVTVAYRFATDIKYKVRDGVEDVIERKADGCRVLSVQ